ncbi:hypothetical protein OKW40_000684 [Paraburkholderia sp. RAU6.4a]|uniref:hypothetical protein n=1 Tax=Paraburkholderia sp. RAU6.4a TaxID=2991067 RepID=UPI003D212174
MPLIYGNRRRLLDSFRTMNGSRFSPSGALAIRAGVGSRAMAFQDKLRALMFGIPAGVPSQNLGGETVLLLKDVPLELESALRGWLWSQPALVREDSPSYALRFDPADRMAIPWDVWEHYLSWVQDTLADALKF